MPQICPLEPQAPTERPGLLPGHLLLQWHITDRCNLRCRHCYQEDARADETAWVQMAAIVEQFSGLLVRLGSLRGAPLSAHVTVTGGEPLLHPHLLPLLETLRSRELPFAVLTNGTLVDRRWAQALARLQPRFVQVSIEGDEATHDSIRGAGAFGAAVSGLRHLVRERVVTMLAFTARADNYRQFPQVVALARRLRLGSVWADRMVPLGHGETEQVLSAAQTRRLCETIGAETRRRGGARGGTEVLAHRALQFAATGGRPYRCSAGRSLIALLPNGDVLPCRRLPRVAGNVFCEPLANLYLQSPLLRALRQPTVPAACRACFYAETCAGGLRCLADAVNGDPFSADPGCWLVPGDVGSDTATGTDYAIPAQSMR